MNSFVCRIFLTLNVLFLNLVLSSSSFLSPEKFELRLEDITNPDVQLQVKTAVDDRLETIYTKSRSGQTFVCYLPSVNVNDEKANNSTVYVVNTTDVSLRLRGGSQGSKLCPQLSKGWWTYEFCFGRELTQFHLEKVEAKPTNVIVLGVFSHEYNWDNKTFDLNLKTSRNQYHVQYYVNGSVCDLTGEWRETEVRFYCSSKFSLTITEPVTCKYRVHVNTPALCDIPVFQNDELETKVSQILCVANTSLVGQAETAEELSYDEKDANDGLDSNHITDSNSKDSTENKVQYFGNPVPLNKEVSDKVSFSGQYSEAEGGIPKEVADALDALWGDKETTKNVRQFLKSFTWEDMRMRDVVSAFRLIQTDYEHFKLFGIESDALVTITLKILRELEKRQIKHSITLDELQKKLKASASLLDRAFIDEVDSLISLVKVYIYCAKEEVDDLNALPFINIEATLSELMSRLGYMKVDQDFYDTRSDLGAAVEEMIERYLQVGAMKLTIPVTSIDDSLSEEYKKMMFKINGLEQQISLRARSIAVAINEFHSEKSIYKDLEAAYKYLKSNEKQSSSPMSQFGGKTPAKQSFNPLRTDKVKNPPTLEKSTWEEYRSVMLNQKIKKSGKESMLHVRLTPLFSEDKDNDREDRDTISEFFIDVKDLDIDLDALGTNEVEVRYHSLPDVGADELSTQLESLILSAFTGAMDIPTVSLEASAAKKSYDLKHSKMLSAYWSNDDQQLEPNSNAIPNLKTGAKTKSDEYSRNYNLI